MFAFANLLCKQMDLRVSRLFISMNLKIIEEADLSEGVVYASSP